MGVSTDGILAYGYDLGDGDQWNLKEAEQSESNPYGYLKLSWYDDENEEITDEDGTEPGVIELMVRRLYESIPDAPEAKYDFQREEVVKDRLGVWFESHCSDEAPMWILTAHVVTARRGYPQVLDLADLVDQAWTGGWDLKLAHALAVLDITPTQEKPTWLLASYWG